MQRPSHRRQARESLRRAAVSTRNLVLEPLEERRLLTVTQLVADLTVSGPIVEMGGLAYFAGTTSANGSELWVSDGTVAGTHLVADIQPGAASSSPTYLANVGGVLYFRATLGDNDAELWKSDGTEAGTQLVADIQPGPLGSAPSRLIDVGGMLYFHANDGVHGHELWTSDGTSAGTHLVADIVPGSGGLSANVLSLTAVGSTLFFVADDGVSGSELWQTDGTPGGTQLVKDIRLGGSSNPANLINVGGTLYFSANDNVNGAELWKSDGTAAGTELVKDIRAGAAGSSPTNLMLFDGALYFVADDGTNDREIWTSDGTSGGTHLVQAVADSSNSPTSLTSVGDDLYFVINSSLGDQIWKTDGSASGAQQVALKNTSTSQLTNIGGTLFFSANDSISGIELWISDGTAIGTRMVVDARSGNASSSPANFSDVNGALYFTANDGTASRLWTVTKPILLPYGGSAYSVVPAQELTLAGSVSVVGTAGTLSYSWDLNGDGIYGDATGLNPTVTWAQLLALGYNVDTPSFQARVRADDDLGNFGISPVVTITVAAASPGHFEFLSGLQGPTLGSSPDNLLTIGSTTYFTANDGIHGSELWKTNGMPGGTSLVADLRSGLPSAAPHNFIDVGGTLFFWANSDGGQSEQLWKSDGTAAGTILLSDFGAIDLWPVTNLAVADNYLFFVNRTSAGAIGLWASDGTPAGTLQVLASPTASVGTLMAVDNRVFFDATTSASGNELWVSDGTTSGTYLVSDINAGTASSGPDLLAAFGGNLLFRAVTTAAGNELWVSDGSSAGTVLLKDLYTGTSSSSPSNFTLFNGAVYFTAQTGSTQYSLWKTDGTTAGTVLVSSLPPYPWYIVAAGSGMFIGFENSGIHEWWHSDGTTAGTVALPGMHVDPFASSSAMAIGDRLAVFLSSSYMGASLGSVVKFVDPVTGFGSGISRTDYMYFRIVAGDFLYFNDGSKLYKTDGSAVGTSIVQSLSVSTLSPVAVALGSRLIVTSSKENYGEELWITDGTAAGTSLVYDVNTQPSGSTRGALGTFGGEFFFYITDTVNGTQLWKTDGSQAGTVYLGSPFASTGFSVLGYTNGQLFLRQAYQVATSTRPPITTVTRYALVVSDGSPSGTQKLLSNQGTLSGVVLGDQMILSAGSSTDKELWVSDGTIAGTVQLADIRPGTSVSSTPSSLTVVGDRVYFTADDGANGIELWSTDGTAAGTQLVADINPGSASSSPTNLVDIDGVLYFSATDGTTGVELWKSDGTPGGTLLVADINPGTASSSPGKVVVAGGTRFFIANNGVHGTELWTTDGESAGTTIFKDINTSGSTGSNPTSLVVLNDALYFNANDGISGSDLWRSDGTLAGTIALTTTTGTQFTAAGDYVYFLSSSLKGLWRTDGTLAGTQLLHTSSTSIQFLDAVGGTLYFGAGDALYGNELWQSDGTVAGTRLALDFNQGGANANPLYLTSYNDALLFFGTNGTSSGLWKFTPDRAPTADAGGDYWIAEGDSLALDASTSSDPDGDALTYSWDVNGDGIFADASGVAPTLSWAALQALDIDSGPHSWNVAVRIDDGFGHVVTSASSQLTVNNVAPTAGISGPASTARDASANYTLTATDPAAVDQSAGFTWSIDWNGDGSDVQVINGLSGLIVAHTFSSVGARTIKVTATDNDGGVSSQSTHAVSVSAATVDLNGDLVWTGTAGDDSVSFEDLRGGQIRVTTTLDNGLATNFVETISGVTGIVKATGLAGNDTLDAALLSATSARLDGGTGNNTLYGGDANDVLIGGGNVAPKHNGPEGQQGSNIIVGGAGDDTIYGNAINGAEGKGGNNILVGGDGNDTIYGNWTDGGEGGGRNIIVGGADADTLYDYKIADGAEGKGSILVADELDESLGVPQLQQIMLEWSSTHNYNDRVNNILGPGSVGRLNGNAYLQPGTTVTSDAAIDQLWGTTSGSAFNWFLYTLAVDEINRDKVGETKTTL